MEDSARTSVNEAEGITPQTTIVTVRWRPTPKVYDFRISLLTFLEERKLLQAFQVKDDISRAMISDTAEIALTPRGISIGMHSGIIESGILLPIFDQLLQTLRPRVTRINAQFQHLVNLTGFESYDQARSVALAGVFGSLAEDLSLIDSAVLVDGALGTPEATFKAEFGVVEKAEAAERLRHAGDDRISSADEPNFSHIEWEDRELPEIGLYIDSRWHDHQEIPSELNEEWFIERVELYKTRANKLAAMLFERTVFGQPQPR